MPLLYLRLLGLVGILFGQLCVFFVLLLLELLAILVLLGDQLVLLFLEFRVIFCISSIGSGALDRRKVIGMDGVSSTRGGCAMTWMRCVLAPRLSCGHGAALKVARPRSRGDRRLAMVSGRSQLRI